ncbi:MAG: xanthine dehydrogenase family protein [Deltaproteobacteria bacterium]|nr:xanthine dehydrogenase family protein [Deltaproteobacteria bacterium]
MTEKVGAIGSSIPRRGALDRLTGASMFSADFRLENPLALRAVRSPHSHARVLRIDTEEASRMPGVARIFTARDIPGKNLTGIINKDRPLLVEDKVRFVGDPVALVAAETEEAAERAAGAVNVLYEVLPAVYDPADALANEAPLIHEKGNLLFRRRVVRGDAASAFSSCAVVVEETYRTSFLEHCYLEPDAGAGWVDADGTLVIIASTQNPHYDHSEVAALLGVEDGRIRIIQAATGGGFGSKLDLNMQGFIGLALYHLQRPVRCVYSREETFIATSKRHALIMEMKTGAGKDGRLHAMKCRILCDTGAYGSYGIAVASRAAVHAGGPYEIEHVDTEVLCVYTNNPVAGAMRGFGTPQVAFAHESQMDLLAEKLGMDPFEIRRRNALRVGSVTATGQKLEASVGIGECLDAIKESYEKARSARSDRGDSPFTCRGVGIGAMWYGIGNTGMQNPSTAQVEIDLDGAVTLYTGCADIGQGSTTVLAQIAAGTLGLAPDEIRMIVADTKLTTNAGATSASRQTYISGNAVRDAAAKLVDVLLTEAVDLMKVPKNSLAVEGGFVVYKGDTDRRIAFSKLAARARRKGIPLRWQGYFDPVTSPLNPDTGHGEPYATYAYACHLAEVTVDITTGEVTVDRVVAAHDVGRAIHPEGVVGQICGGVAMGVGFALMEEFKPGVTASFKDYHIPTANDMPEVVPLIVESSEPTGPFGAKGVGEPALIPTAPAVLNALSDALGKRIYHLPANLERVLEAANKRG